MIENQWSSQVQFGRNLSRVTITACRCQRHDDSCFLCGLHRCQCMRGNGALGGKQCAIYINNEHSDNRFCSHITTILNAKSIDLLGNLVYSVSCEGACGVVWNWQAHLPFLDPLWRYCISIKTCAMLLAAPPSGSPRAAPPMGRPFERLPPPRKASPFVACRERRACLTWPPGAM